MKKGGRKARLWGGSQLRADTQSAGKYKTSNSVMTQEKTQPSKWYYGLKYKPVIILEKRLADR